MSPRSNDFALGLTAIGLTALAVLTILFLASPWQVKTRHVVIHFPHELGMAPLKAGSRVLLSGAIDVGHVSKVEPRELPPAPGQGHRPRTVIVAEAEIDRNLSLYGNCEITTDMPLVGGSGTIVIANVGTPDVPLGPGPIEGLPPQGLAAFSAISRRLTTEGGLVDRLDRALDPEAPGSLLNKVTLSLSDINALTGALRTQLTAQEQSTLLGKIHLILDDLNGTIATVRDQLRADNGTSLLAKVHAGLDALHEDLTELQAMLAENRPAIRNTLTGLEHATQAVDTALVARLTAQFDPQNSESLLSKLHAAMDRLNAALADLQVASETGKRLFVLNRPAIEAILVSLQDMSSELAQTSKELRLNPSRLIWGPGNPQKDKLGVFMAARDFAQAATYLDETAARLQAIVQVSPADSRLADSDDEVREIYESLRAAFERFRRAEQFFWDQMK